MTKWIVAIFTTNYTFNLPENLARIPSGNPSGKVHCCNDQLSEAVNRLSLACRMCVMEKDWT